MLPVKHHACAETTGALWSSRTMMVRPLSRVTRRVPGGQAGMLPADFLKATRVRGTTDARIRIKTAKLESILSKRNSTLFRFGQRHRDCPRRQIRFAKSLVEVVAAFEIVAAVPFRLGQQPGFDHIENDFSKVLAAFDAPRFEHRE